MKRNQTIDIARGIAMLYIIGLWHMSQYSEVFEVPYGVFLKNASLGLFMFVSGYLLGAKYKIHNISDAGIFIKKRFFRLYPLYVLSLLLFWLRAAITTKTFVLSLFGISCFIQPQPPTLWFVSMLLIFYLVFIFVSGRSTKSKTILSVLLYVFLITLSYFFRDIDYRILFYFPCFFVGVIMSDVPLANLTTARAGIVSLCVFVLSVYLISSHTVGGFVPYCIFRFTASLSGCFLVLFVAGLINAIPKVNNFFGPLSFASMSAYMFHRQIISFVRYIYWPEPSIWRVVFLYLFCLPLVLVAGYAIQYAYDRLIRVLELL